MNSLKTKIRIKESAIHLAGSPRASSPTSSSLSLDTGFFFNGWKQVNAYYGPKEGYCTIPSSPGNYAIYTCPKTIDGMDMSNKVLRYIGTAVNLSKRHKRHEVVRILRALTDDSIFIKCRVVLDKTLRLTSEYRFINRLKPGCNNEPKKRRFTSYAILCG